MPGFINFRTDEWNWLDSPAEDVVLVAPLHVQVYVLLFGCSTVSQGLNPQKVAFAHSDSRWFIGWTDSANLH